MKPMVRQSSSGFTLMECAVVIAIVGILAAVAIPRFTDTSSQAELTQIKDFKASLTSAARMYRTAQNMEPTLFSQYVSNQPGGATSGNNTITTYGIGPNGTSSACTVAGAVITCSGTFNKWSRVTYTINNAGQITGTAMAGNGNTLGNATF